GHEQPQAHGLGRLDDDPQPVRAVLPGALAHGVRVHVGADGAVAVRLAVPRLLPLPALSVGAAER
ncbi:MAG TPA: hypothetical protein VK546_03865, partial [Gaiellales bacterium]|nr:hypothetical protein [Gaiellales bacterium]